MKRNLLKNNENVEGSDYIEYITQNEGYADSNWVSWHVDRNTGIIGFINIYLLLEDVFCLFEAFHVTSSSI